VDGVSFDDNSSVKEAIVNFYKELYEDHPSRPFLEGLVYDSISDDEACGLLREFSKEEVWEAINDLGKEKAPGLMVSTLLSSNIGGVLLRKK